MVGGNQDFCKAAFRGNDAALADKIWKAEQVKTGAIEIEAMKILSYNTYKQVWELGTKIESLIKSAPEMAKLLIEIEVLKEFERVVEDLSLLGD